ncbi:hypothetical protein [Candidatus Berkiella aquae]|uniref:Uncharacterized protein n=1 Tax=Candidatus Berkiella aquae TaxID=295108 RepID=A0A0Q9YV32_9GAMM|nr:hypothetical protein [Candidatus Berkiella aquae]MCS5711516.1 hypothetical protein [Candidatus Berkiella aquae]
MTINMYGPFTAEEIEIFYPLLQETYTHGYQYKAPAREKFKQDHGMTALGRFQNFVKTFLPKIPDSENKLPTLEELLACLESMPKTPTLIFTADNIIGGSDEIEASIKPKKKRFCTIL